MTTLREAVRAAWEHVEDCLATSHESNSFTDRMHLRDAIKDYAKAEAILAADEGEYEKVVSAMRDALSCENTMDKIESPREYCCRPCTVAKAFDAAQAAKGKP